MGGSGTNRSSQAPPQVVQVVSTQCRQRQEGMFPQFKQVVVGGHLTGMVAQNTTVSPVQGRFAWNVCLMPQFCFSVRQVLRVLSPRGRRVAAVAVKRRRHYYGGNPGAQWNAQRINRSNTIIIIFIMNGNRFFTHKNKALAGKARA